MILYRFFKATHAIKTIQDKRLKVSNIDDTNDPFEVSFINRDSPERGQLASAIQALLAKNHNLVCFSESWRHPRMWTRYAEEHRGICLGFRFGKKLIESGECKPVEYINEPLTLDWGPEAHAESVRQLAWTKHKSWSYEREHRLFTEPLIKDRENRAFLDLDDELQICELIAGLRCELSAPHRLSVDSGIPMFRAIASSRGYLMDREMYR